MIKEITIEKARHRWRAAFCSLFFLYQLCFVFYDIIKNGKGDEAILAKEHPYENPEILIGVFFLYLVSFVLDM